MFVFIILERSIFDAVSEKGIVIISEISLSFVRCISVVKDAAVLLSVRTMIQASGI